MLTFVLNNKWNSKMYHVSSKNNTEHKVSLQEVELILEQKLENWDLRKIRDSEYSLIYNNKSYHIFIEQLNKSSKELHLMVNGQFLNLGIEEPIDVLLKKMGIDMASMQKVEPLKAPMPGLVLKILVEEGQEIKKGTPLLILEAMKMENVFKATADATIEKILVEEGQAIEKAAVLIELN